MTSVGAHDDSQRLPNDHHAYPFQIVEVVTSMTWVGSFAEHLVGRARVARV